MDDTLRIAVATGLQARPLVDPFYERHASNGRARDTDLFFMALLADQLIGSVRYCVEEGAPMLRTMMVDQGHRRDRVGRRLLEAFAEFLDRNGIREVHCVPYSHLEGFYGLVGFKKIRNDETPAFLLERIRANAANGSVCICMKRP